MKSVSKIITIASLVATAAILAGCGSGGGDLPTNVSTDQLKPASPAGQTVPVANGTSK